MTESSPTPSSRPRRNLLLHWRIPFLMDHKRIAHTNSAAADHAL